MTYKNFGLAGVASLLAMLGVDKAAGKTLIEDPGGEVQMAKIYKETGSNKLTIKDFKLSSDLTGIREGVKVKIETTEAGADEGKVAGASSGTWNLAFAGSNEITGYGTIAAIVKMSSGDDRIGNLASDFTDSRNKLTFTSELALGHGDNTVKAISVAEIRGGDGSDTVILKEGAGVVRLGGGTNTLEAESLKSYVGGNGVDDIEISANVTGRINLGAGKGNNTLDVSGKIGRTVKSEADSSGTDTVFIGGGSGNVNLGEGANFLTLRGDWSGAYTGGTGVDTITVNSGVTASSPSAWGLSGGNNVIKGAGTILASIVFGKGNDIIGQHPAGLTTTQKSAANMLTISGAVDLGSGANVVYAKAVSSSGSIEGGKDSDSVFIDGGQGDINLGNGLNALTLNGNWAGMYTGGSGVDTITINSGAIVTGSGEWSLGAGNDIVKGSGTISRGVYLGGGDDFIGLNPADLTKSQKLAANTLTISGAVRLGSGTNKAYVKAISTNGSITGGESRDDVFIYGGVAAGGGAGTVSLGDGSNTLTLGGDWSGKYVGGADSDTIIVESGVTASGSAEWVLGGKADVIKGSGTVSVDINMGPGDDVIGDDSTNLTSGQKLQFNTLTLSGEMKLGGGINKVHAKAVSSKGSIKGGDSSDSVFIDGGQGGINLGNGQNALTLNGNWSGLYTGGLGIDTITINSGSTVTGSGEWSLGAGDDVVKGSGTISRIVHLGDGDDFIGVTPAGLTSSQKSAANTLTISREVKLGGGTNTVHAKNISEKGLVTGGPGPDE